MSLEQRLAERQAGLDEWRQESLTALLRWAETIGADPEQMLLDPTIGIAPAERMLDNEDVGALPTEDRDWVTSHLLAHVAFILMHNHGGEWADRRRPRVADLHPLRGQRRRHLLRPGPRGRRVPEVPARWPGPRCAHRGRRSAPDRTAA